MNVAKRCAAMPPTSRRVVALVGIPLLISLLVATLTAPILYSYRSQVRWREGTSVLLGDAQRAASIREELEREFAAVKSSSLWGKFYADGSGSGGVTALHSDLASILGGAQISAQSLTPLPSTEQEGLVKLGTKFTASMRVDQLQSFLSALAAFPRYLRVERITIVAPQSQDARENPPLAVTVELYGYELQVREAQQASIASAGVISQ